MIQVSSTVGILIWSNDIYARALLAFDKVAMSVTLSATPSGPLWINPMLSGLD